jgi:hypothetical protein
VVGGVLQDTVQFLESPASALDRIGIDDVDLAGIAVVRPVAGGQRAGEPTRHPRYLLHAVQHFPRCLSYRGRPFAERRHDRLERKRAGSLAATDIEE